MRAQVGAARVEHDGVRRRLDQTAVAREHELQQVFAQRVLGLLVQRLQKLHRLRGLGLWAIDLELLVAVRYAHLQRRFDGAQVRVGRPAQVREPGVVVGGEGVAQDHADNLGRIPGHCKACSQPFGRQDQNKNGGSTPCAATGKGSQ